jgi:hypothetical protein
MLTLLLVTALPSFSFSTFEETIIKNTALSGEVRAASPLYRTGYEFVVSDDGSSVFSLFSQLNRYATRSQDSKVGEVIVFRRIEGKDWSLTMSQSAHAKAPSRNLKGYTIDLIGAKRSSAVNIQYTTATGAYLSEINMDQRGPKPNKVLASVYLWHATGGLTTDDEMWGFRKVGDGFFLDCRAVTASSISRISTVALPGALHPLGYDPRTRRVVALHHRDNIAIYHPRSRSMRLLPIPEEQGRYWMSQGEVYFQGTGQLMIARGNKWEPMSDDIFLGKSANDKYWLMRRKDEVILRTFN